MQEFARHDEGFEGALIFQNRLEHSKRPSRIEVAGGIRVRDLKVLQEKGLQAVRDSVDHRRLDRGLDSVHGRQ